MSECPKNGFKRAEVTRAAIREAAEDLRRLDQRLAEIVSNLPLQTDGFSLLGEFRGGVECVRSDLLEDAIDSLTTLATISEEELREQHEECAKWFVAAVV